ncbi:MAG TPA: hypothetical protein VGJ91_18525, partial [Polyangiaceae bacterium]
QLSYLSVTLSAEAQVPGVQVDLDGEPVLTFGIMFPVDSGSHRLRASAPGKKPWSDELSIQNGNQRQSVTIPGLIEADVVPAVPQAPAKATSKTAASSTRALEPSTRADFTGVYIAGATTLTLTAGAVISAFAYYDRRAAYHDAISNPDSADAAEQSARHDAAEQMAWINGSLIVAAGIGAAVTGVLWYRAAHSKKVRVAEGAWVAPLVVGSGAGLQAGASF